MTDSTEAKADGDNVNWEVSRARMVDGFGCCCQAPSQIPNPQGPAPSQSNPVKISSKGTGADTKILWATTHPTHPTHPQLLSMKEASNKKTKQE